jgi:hypothetical protein
MQNFESPLVHINETKMTDSHVQEISDMSIGYSPSGCGMECYPPHPGSIPVSDILSS